jgi:hypothetical protein
VGQLQIAPDVPASTTEMVELLLFAVFAVTST